MNPDTDLDLEAGPDMEATIREGYKKFREEAEPEPEKASEPATGKEVAPEAAPAAPAKPERTRSEDGKFVKAAEQAAAVDPATPQVKRKPPSTWRKEAVAKWDALDPLVQEEVEKRELDAINGINTYKSKGDLAEQWERAISPYQATIQSMNISPQKAAQALFAADHAMRYGTPHQKLAMIQKMAKDYGIQMEGLPEPEQEDPRISALQQKLDEIDRRDQARDAALAADRDETAKKALDEFREKAPHLDAVREDMAALIETGRASNLQDAYDKAVWGKAELRDALIAEQLKGKTDEAARIASDARKAASVNIPAKGKVAASPPKGSMEDDLKAGVKRLGLFQ